MTGSKLTMHKLCQICIFTAVMVASVLIPPIPLPGGVPMTLQTLVIALAGLVLGPKHGAMATVTYVLLGAVGLPVFAGFRGGIGIILGYTGGFILSFPLLALLAGLGERTGKISWTYAGLVAGMLLNLTIGMLYYSRVASTSIPVAFFAVVAPFIPISALEVALLPPISKGIKTALTRARVRI